MYSLEVNSSDYCFWVWVKYFLVCFILCDWRVTSATDVSDHGGCSCVQDTSVTLCEETLVEKRVRKLL